jgi:hypothetical protein
MNKQEKIEKTLNSMENIHPAKANPFLYEKIRNRMNEKNKVKSAGRGFVFAAALTIIAVLILNISALKNYSDKTAITFDQTTTKQDITSFAKEYYNLNSTYSY